MSKVPLLVGLSEATYLRVRTLVVSGRFVAGQRLGEVELSQELGVSRTPVREALRRLQSDGLVQPSGRGVVLASLSAQEVFDSYRLRAALEGLTAELAAERNAAGLIAPADLARLDELAEMMEGSVARHDVGAMRADNLRFHEHVCALAANELVHEALERLWNRISVSSLSNLHDAAWAAEVVDHHRQLVTAVRTGIPADAARIAQHHVLAAAAVYKAHAERRDERS